MLVYPMRNAFSLVELSIVLVILGLLTGGILSGQSLIRASELRAVTTEYQRYFSATQAFRDKYFSLPGDMPNATLFWGTTTTAGTVSGNGDGNIDIGSGALVTGEVHQYWRQLALAGLIEGTYSGTAGPASANDFVIGTNAPRSRMGNAAWSVHNIPGTYAGDANHVGGIPGNFYSFGATCAGCYTDMPLLKPEEAWNLDTKIDDGKPIAGKVVAVWWSTCTTAASSTDQTAQYLLNSTANACGLYFFRQF